MSVPELVCGLLNESLSSPSDQVSPVSLLSKASAEKKLVVMVPVASDHSHPARLDPLARPRYLHNVDFTSSQRHHHRLRKPSRPPPTSFRAASSRLSLLGPNLDLCLSPQASSSEIARATAIISMATGLSSPEQIMHSRYPRISPVTSNSYGSSNTSGSPSVSSSTSLTSPSLPTRKLPKRRTEHPPTTPGSHFGTPTKSQPPRSSFKLRSPFFTKNPSRMSLYADSLPPLLSQPPLPSFQSQPWDHASDSTPPPASPIVPIRTLPPLDFTEFTSSAIGIGMSSGYGYGSENGAYEAYLDTSHGGVDGKHLSAQSPSYKQKQGTNTNEGANLMRRWSLLEVPDEVLAVELEEMRQATKMKERKRSVRTRNESRRQSSTQKSEEGRACSPGAIVYGGPVSVHRFWLGDDGAHEGNDDRDNSGVSDDGWDVPDQELEMVGNKMEEREEEDWKRTRRALFCCRELIRTEKSYLTRLVQLLEGQTLTPPPALLTTYLPALVVASNTLLDNFTRDPTAYGISKAFVDAESLLENALVAYCGIVGDVFMNQQPEKRKLGRSTRRNSLKSVCEKGLNELVVGRTGESMRGSRYVIAEELSKLQPDGRRKTIPRDFDWKPSEVPQGNEKSPLAQADKQEMGEKLSRGGTLKRTMSLFKRKSLPPSPGDISESRWSQPSSRSSPIFSFSKIARSTSFISFSGINPSTKPVPPPKHPPPVPSKDTRPHALSDPIPPSKAVLEHGTYDISTWPVSNVGYLGSSNTHGDGISPSPGHDDKSKMPTVRDLAILPTQRVMRFVLLYRDLLDHTPKNSPTRPLVEKALEGAIRIAGKCDRAQGNATFLRRE